MAFNVDLSKFKKVKSDDKKTIMRHADGHELTIAHSALSKKMKQQLDSLESEEKSNPKIEASKQHLYDGGKAEPQPQSKDDVAEAPAKNAKDMQKGATDPGYETPTKYWENIKHSVGYFKGGNVPKTPTEEDSIPVSLTPSIPEGLANPTPGSNFSSGNPQQMSQSQQDIQNLPYGITPEQYHALQPDKDVPATDNDPTKSTQPDDSNPAPQSRNIAQSPATDQPAEQPLGTPQDTISGQHGFETEKAGIEAGAKAQGNLGKAEAEKYNQAISDQQAAAKSFQDANQALNQERIAHVNDVQNNLINPEKYWDNHSRVATGIGLILAGFNPTNRPNAALEFLKSNIDNSVKAQEANLGAKQSLLSANLAQFKNMRDATDMTRLMQSDIVVNQLHQAAAKAQDPMAKARALQEAGKLEREYAPLHMQLAMKEGLIKMANQGGNDPDAVGRMLPALRVMNPEMAKEMEGRYVPGIGMASIPLTAEVRSQLVARQQLDKAANELRSFAQKHSGSLDPAIIAEGRTRAAELQSMYRNSINGGVFKKGEQEFIGNIINDDPTAFFNKFRVDPKFKAIIDTNAQQLNSLKSANGLPTQQIGPQLTPEQQHLVGLAKANPNHPMSAAVLKKYGQ